MMRLALAALFALNALPASAGEIARTPFVVTLSNTAPLAFGMTAEDASFVLGAPLQYVRGEPGHELFVTSRPGRGLFNRHARLFLQFRDNRLTGWKDDWSRNWMWR